MMGITGGERGRARGRWPFRNVVFIVLCFKTVGLLGTDDTYWVWLLRCSWALEHVLWVAVSYIAC